MAALDSAKMILQLTEFIGLLGEGKDKITINKLKNQATSISQLAKKSVMLYPVIMSASVGDVKIASDITKYLEIQYGIFTLLALGISTDISSTKAEDVLKVVSAESSGNIISDRILSQATEDFKEYIFSDKVKQPHRIGKYYSKEAVHMENAPDDQKVYDVQEEQDKREKELNKRQEKLDAINKAMKKVEVNFMSRLPGIKAEPTVLNIETNVGGTNIRIPIAIKANMHPVKSDEIRMILESGIEGKLPSLRITKALTGEISLIRDLLLQMDKAERDKHLYKTMGRHPWFRQLQDRKLKGNTNLLRRIINSRSSTILPTASLIVTKDDLTLSTKLNYSYFLKNEKLLKSIMQSMFLLSLGVYDPEMETVSFFFSGFKNPFIYTLNDLRKGGQDPNASLFDALRELSRKI